jgi:hypothetical protein
MGGHRVVADTVRRLLIMLQHPQMLMLLSTAQQDQNLVTGIYLDTFKTKTHLSATHLIL